MCDAVQLLALFAFECVVVKVVEVQSLRYLAKEQ